jgi:hypothetical protein
LTIRGKFRSNSDTIKHGNDCSCRPFDPYTYLRDVLTRLPNMTNWQVPEVTPEAWVKAQRAAERAAAS